MAITTPTLPTIRICSTSLSQKVGDTTAVRVTNDTVRSVYNYFWKGDRIVYLQDIGGR